MPPPVSRTTGGEQAPVIRVLHVLEALEGGTARHLVDLVRATDGVEHHVVVPHERIGAATDRTAIAAMQAAGARVHILAMTRRPLSVHNVMALRQIARLLRTVRPTVLHVHSSVGGALGRVANVAARVPVVYTPNGLASQRSARLIERLLGHLADRIVAVSPSEAALVRGRRLVDHDDVLIIPNGVDLEHRPDRIDVRALLDIPAGSRIVGMIARLVPQKAPEVFVESCARLATTHPDVHFVLVGDGPLAATVRDRVRTSGLGDRFHLVPELEAAAGVLPDFDVFALSSRFEGAPYAPMEAMLVNVPIVLTDVVGNRDLIARGVDGVLVATDDSHALAAAIGDLLDDPARAAELADAAFVRLSESHDLATTTKQLRDLYVDLARSRRPAAPREIGDD